MLGIVSTILAILMLALPIGSSVRRHTKVGQWILWAALASAGCYVLLMLSVQATEFHLENKLVRYDLNGDGMFSGEELKPEMKRAMDDVTNDTGRSLAPITGLITCPLYSGFWHFGIGVPYLLIRRRDKKIGEQDATSNGGQRPSLNSGFSPRRG
jgi:hypothetical protein